MNPKLARLYEDIFLNRRRPVYPRAFNGSLDCFIAYNPYGGHCIPWSVVKSGPAQAIMAGSVWEPDLLNFIVDNANGDVIHAGAFFGDGLPMLSRGIAPHTLWAFEPTDLYYYASMTHLISKLSFTGLYHMALGAESKGTTVAIDDIIPKDRRISIIHLDIEGDEQKALEGAQKTIERCKPILVVEEVFSKVTPPKGYGYLRSFGNNLVYVC